MTEDSFWFTVVSTNIHSFITAICKFSIMFLWDLAHKVLLYFVLCIYVYTYHMYVCVCTYIYIYIHIHVVPSSHHYYCKHVYVHVHNNTFCIYLYLLGFLITIANSTDHFIFISFWSDNTTFHEYWGIPENVLSDWGSCCWQGLYDHASERLFSLIHSIFIVHSMCGLLIQS